MKRKLFAFLAPLFFITIGFAGWLLGVTFTAATGGLGNQAAVCYINNDVNGYRYVSIERAIEVANSRAGSGSEQNVYVKTNLGQTVYLNKDITLNSYVNLILPYNKEGQIDNGSNFVKSSLTAFVDKNASGVNTYRVINVDTNGYDIVLSENSSLSIGGYSGNDDCTYDYCAGTMSGYYAQLTLSEGSKIIANSDSTVNVYGYIKQIEHNKYKEGEDQSNNSSITLESGSKINSVLVIYDFKGGGRTTGILNHKNPLNLPFYIFDLPTIQTKTIFKYGSQAYCSVKLQVDSNNYATSVMFIGTSGDTNALMQISSFDGRIEYEYIPTNRSTGLTDRFGRSNIDFYGENNFNQIKINDPITIASSDTIFPINQKYSFTVHENAELNMLNSVKFLPGSSLIVDKGGVVNISAGKILMSYTKFQYCTQNENEPWTVWDPYLKTPANIMINGTLQGDGSVWGYIKTGTTGAILNANSFDKFSADADANYETQTNYSIIIKNYPSYTAVRNTYDMGTELELTGDLDTSDNQALGNSFYTSKYKSTSKYYWSPDPSITAKIASFTINGNNTTSISSDPGKSIYVLVRTTWTGEGYDDAEWQYENSLTQHFLGEPIFTVDKSSRVATFEVTIKENLTSDTIYSSIRFALIKNNSDGSIINISSKTATIISAKPTLSIVYEGGDTVATESGKEGWFLLTAQYSPNDLANTSLLWEIPNESNGANVYFVSSQGSKTKIDSPTSTSVYVYIGANASYSNLFSLIKCNLYIHEEEISIATIYACATSLNVKLTISSENNKTETGQETEGFFKITATVKPSDNFSFKWSIEENNNGAIFVSGNDNRNEIEPLTTETIWIYIPANDGDNDKTCKITCAVYYGEQEVTLSSDSVKSIVLTAKKPPCLLPDTLITLKDGSKKMVKDIQAGEELLVFNHETGELDCSPVIFNDSDAAQEFNVINLRFSNGKEVGVISEHGFFDVTINKYVYVDENNALEYIGHEFYVMDGSVAKLNDVTIERQFTECYSPVTSYHLNYFTEDILSMPGGIEGLFNIFEYGKDLKYDEKAKQADIDKYGLFTYDDFKDYMPYEAYCLFPAPYLKVSIGKGLITFDDILAYIERYDKFWL